MFSVSAIYSSGPSSASSSSDAGLSPAHQRALYISCIRPLEQLAEEIAQTLKQHPEADLAEVQRALDDEREPLARGQTSERSKVESSNEGASSSIARSISRTFSNLASQVEKAEETGLVSSSRGKGRKQHLDALHPLLFLPGQHHTLGPLLPRLLKRLLPLYIQQPASSSSSQTRSSSRRRCRVLIYAPSGGSLQAASMLASSLTSLAESIAEQIDAEAKAAGEASHLANLGKGKGKALGVRMRGFVSLHDLATLESEAKEGTNSWVAITSDRILAEKLSIFDLLLDLSSVGNGSFSASSSRLPQERGSSSMPTLSSVVPAKPGSRNVHRAFGKALTLRNETWTAREFSAWNEVDQSAEQLLEEWFLERRAQRRSTRSMSTALPAAHEEDQRTMPGALADRPLSSATSSVAQRGSFFATLFVFLRYCLGTWHWLPSFLSSRLSSGLSVIPLGIRGDGGARSSMILMLSDEEESDDGDDSDETAPAQPRSIAKPPSSDAPLLAAAGATSLSRSPIASYSPTASSNVNRVYLRESDKSDGRQAGSHGAEEGVASSVDGSSAIALQQAWLAWGAGLILGAADVVNDATSLRLENLDSQASLTIEGKDLRNLNLSPREDADLALVRAVAAANATEVRFQAGWGLLLNW